MSRRKANRQLIQFSTYSIAVVLPKKILRQLAWEAGDTVFVRLDPQKTRLLIEKEEKPLLPNEPAESISPETQIANHETLDTQTGVQPIPEIVS